MKNIHENTQWYYAKDKVQYGPYDTDTIRSLIQEGYITDNTLFWYSGLDKWMHGRDIEGLFPEEPPVLPEEEHISEIPLPTPAPASSPVGSSKQETAPKLKPTHVDPPKEDEEYNFGTSSNTERKRIKARSRTHTPQPGVQTVQTVTIPHIPNLLPISIIATVICCTCFPTGIIAIIYSAKANKAKSLGHYEEAIKANNVAKFWLVITFVLGILFFFMGLLSEN